MMMTVQANAAAARGAQPMGLPNKQFTPAANLVDVDFLPSQLPDNSPPVYPAEALQKRIEGTVVMRAMISDQGKVDTLSLYRSSGNLELDTAALTAVRRWRFRPALFHGVVVPY